MPHRGAFCGDITAERCQDGGDGGTYIGAEDKGTGEVESYPSFAAHYKSDGEGGGRRLDYHRNNETHQGKDKDGFHTHRRIIAQRFEHFRVALQVRDIIAYHIQTHEKEAEADKKFAYILCLALVEKKQNHCQADKRE